MTVKRILLTGDDGYKSIGTRILIHWLKDKFDLAVAGTQVQQSGVGGMLNIKNGGKFFESGVDGVAAVYVSGTPGDAMEVAAVYFKEKFDLVISGINMGPNVVGELASGTMTAAARAVKLKLAPRAIAFSWDCPAGLWYHDHNQNHNLKEFIDYPGLTAVKLVACAVKADFWGCPLLNINFPAAPSGTARFTRFLAHFDDYYEPAKINLAGKSYSYPLGCRHDTPPQLENDAYCLNAGYISITPCRLDLLAENIYSGLSGKTVTL